MVIDSNSTRRRKHHRGGNNPRKKPGISKGRPSPVSASAKTGSASLRRLTRGTVSRERSTSTSLSTETPPKKESSSVHSNARKSERLEKKDTTPPVKRKSVVLEREKISSSPLRRSGRRKGKVTALPDVNRKKIRTEKSVKELSLEAVETSVAANEVKIPNGRIKKTLNRHTYKALFTQQLRKGTVPDLGKELERPEKLARDDRSCLEVGNSLKDGEDGVEECRENNEEASVERDCSKPNKSNAYPLSNNGAVEISCLNSKDSSKEALGVPLQENGVNAFDGSMIGEEVILLPWYVSDTDRELERPEKLCQDDRSCFGVSASNPMEDGEDGVEECSEKIEEECIESDCEGGKKQFFSKSGYANAYALSNDGALEISHSNSKYCSREALGDPSQENSVNAFNESMIGEEVILLPWYVSDMDKEVERPEKLSQDDRSRLGVSASNPVEDGEDGVEYSGNIEEQCDERDCEGGMEQSVSKSSNANVSKSKNTNAYTLRNKHSSRGTLGEPSRENGVNPFNGSTLGEEIIDDSERLLADHALVVKSQLSDSDILERTGVGSSSLPKCDKDNFVGTCASCSKRRRSREKLSPFVACNCRKDYSRFIEYWVPVSTSNVQLEQYCATLLSNSTTLRSSSFKDIVGGALQDIVVSAKKCCDHPYFVDSGLQAFLTKDLPPVEYLDVGIKASGKLQILDMVLSKIKSWGKRLLILYQSIRSAGMLTGDVLDDFLRQRFGLDAYERVDRGILPSKKQAALNKFNDKGSGRFVFLLEQRACSPTIKLTSVDAVVIFDSDWNLMNDNRALQRLSIDSSPEAIKIFRLYTCCTLEEKVLDLATNNMPLDSTLTMSRTTSHMLLMWGASYLFSKLDGFHGSNALKGGASLFSDISMLQDVAGELLDILIQNAEYSCEKTSITKVTHNGVTYSKSGPLVGQLKVQPTEGKEPHLFWNELLKCKNPCWRFLSAYSHRNRKRVQYFGDLPEDPDGGPADITKKRKKIVNSADAASPRSRQREVSPRLTASLLFSSKNIPPASEVVMSNSKEGIKLRDVQKNLHDLLKSAISEFSETLHLPEDVKAMGERFLEYIVDNHQIHSEPSTILQAFQISLIWIAASLLRYKLDKKESLDAAKQFLGFHCTEVEIINVHSKLRVLKEKFKGTQKFKEIEPTKDFSDDHLEHIRKKCKKRKIKLLRKHEEEVEEFNKIWEKQRAQIENQHRIDSAVVRSIHYNQAVRLENLKRVDEVFAKNMDEHKREKELCLQDLKGKQLNEITEEDEKAENWLKDSTYSSQPEQPIPLSERVGPSDTEFQDGQENVGSKSGEYQAPSMTEVATTVPMTAAREKVGCGVTIKIPTVPSQSLCSTDTTEESNDINLSELAPVENNNTSGRSPLVMSPVMQILETRAQDVVLSQNIALQDEFLRPSTSARILDGDAAGLESTRNILEEAEIELLRPTNTEARQNSCAASLELLDGNIRASESYITDLIEGGSVLAPSNPELTEHHLPRAEQPPFQHVEQPTMQSGGNLFPPLPTRIVDEILQDDVTQTGVPPPTETPVVGFGAHHPSRHTQQMNLQAQPQSLLSDPLQIELERLHKETEEATKFHEDAKLQLKSEYEKDLEELRRKYETKLKCAEAEHLLKKKELDAKQSKVFMNRILAEAFRTKCLEFKPSVSSGMYKVPSTNFVHQLVLPSPQSRTTSAVSGSPNLGPPAASQETAVPSAPALPRSSPTIANMQMRQPRTLPNTRPIGNFPISGEMRAPAPHLRPSLSIPAPSILSGSQGLPGQDPQRRPPFPTAAKVPSRQPMSMPPQPPLVQPTCQPMYDDRVPHPEATGSPNVLPCTPDSRTNFVGLNLSQGGVQGEDRVSGGVKMVHSSIVSDVVYLRDDE